MNTNRAIARGLCALALAQALGCSAPQPSFEDKRAQYHLRVGVDAYRRGDFRAASLGFERALEVARGLSDERSEADALLQLGSVFDTLGDAPRAMELYDEGIAVAERGDAPYDRGVLAGHLNRARQCATSGTLEDAVKHIEAARAAAERIGGRTERAAVLRHEAIVLERQSRFDDAADRANEAEQLDALAPRSPESLAGRADAHLILGRVLRAKGDAVGAVGQFKAAERLARELSDRTLIALALESSGATLFDQGRFEDARGFFRRAFDVNVRIPRADRARANVESLKRIAEKTGDAADLASVEEQVAAVGG